MSIQIFIAFFIYALALIGISLFFSKKGTKNADGFILGNRSTNYWVTAIALQVSDMSHWLFMGLPFVVFCYGLITFWEAFGLVFGMFFCWQFIAAKIRVETEKYDCVTIFSYFEKRFGDNSGTIRLLSSIISIVFLTFYISSGLVALGRLCEAAFGTSYTFGVILGLLIAVVYTLVGGFLSVAWCGFFQGIYVIFMLILVPIVAYFKIGGWTVIAQAAATKGVSLSILPSVITLSFGGMIFSSFLKWGPGYFGQTHLISFFMGIDDPKKIRYAKYVGLTWQVLVLFFAMLLGVVGIAYFNNKPDGELIYILLANKLFSPLFAGFILCALLAVTLSTLGTQILNSGSVMAQDIYKRLIYKNASSKNILFMTRFLSLVIAIISMLIAFDNSKTIYDLVNYAWSGMGSAFGPLVLTTLYSKVVTKQGAIAGIIVGSLVSGAWYSFGLANIPPLIPGFALSYIAIYIVSYLTRKNS